MTRPIVRRVKGARYPDTLSPVWRYRHLHKVFGKLGISSRKELRTALSDAGTVVLESEAPASGTGRQGYHRGR